MSATLEDRWRERMKRRSEVLLFRLAANAQRKPGSTGKKNETIITDPQQIKKILDDQFIALLLNFQRLKEKKENNELQRLRDKLSDLERKSTELENKIEKQRTIKSKLIAQQDSARQMLSALLLSKQFVLNKREELEADLTTIKFVRQQVLARSFDLLLMQSVAFNDTDEIARDVQIEMVINSVEQLRNQRSQSATNKRQERPRGQRSISLDFPLGTPQTGQNLLAALIPSAAAQMSANNERKNKRPFALSKIFKKKDKDKDKKDKDKDKEKEKDKHHHHHHHDKDKHHH